MASRRAEVPNAGPGGFLLHATCLARLRAGTWRGLLVCGSPRRGQDEARARPRRLRPSRRSPTGLRRSGAGDAARGVARRRPAPHRPRRAGTAPSRPGHAARRPAEAPRVPCRRADRSDHGHRNRTRILAAVRARGCGPALHGRRDPARTCSPPKVARCHDLRFAAAATHVARKRCPRRSPHWPPGARSVIVAARQRPRAQFRARPDRDGIASLCFAWHRTSEVRSTTPEREAKGTTIDAPVAGGSGKHGTP